LWRNRLIVAEVHRVIRFFRYNSVAILLGARDVGSRVPVTGRPLLKGRDFPRDNSFTRARRHHGPSSPRVPLENAELNDVRGTSCPFLIFIPPPPDTYTGWYVHTHFSFNNKSIIILIFEIIKHTIFSNF